MLMPASGEETKIALVRAAETLMAGHGTAGVSLREVNRAAGQANASALQYHFGGRDGLVRAIFAKHRPAIEAERHALLDAYEYAGVRDLRLLSGALVAPLASKLRDGDGGRAYLQVAAEVVNRPDPERVRITNDDPSDSTNRWRHLLEPMLDPDAMTIFHTRFTAIRIAHTELARRAAARPRRDDRLFTSRLVDLVTALVATPLSAETAALLAEGRR